MPFINSALGPTPLLPRRSPPYASVCRTLTMRVLVKQEHPHYLLLQQAMPRVLRKFPTFLRQYRPNPTKRCNRRS